MEAERPGPSVDKPLQGDDTVARAQKGDRAAFAALIDAHYDFLYRTAYKWCGNREDAEDVAQEVCVKLAGALGGFDGRAKFTSWLYRIVINAVRDRQRQGMRQRRQAGELMHVTARVSEAEQESVTTQNQVWDAVRKLPGKQRDAVLLVYGEDMSHAEAAAIMGTRESTVSWYVHEARKTLKGLV